MHEDRAVRSRHLLLVHYPSVSIQRPGGNVFLGRAIEAPAAPALRVNNLDAIKRFLNIVLYRNPASGSRCLPPELLHQLIIQLVSRRMRDCQLMTHLRRRQRKTVRHRHWQRLRMPGPSQQDFLAVFAKLLSNRHHVSQRLTRMMHRRFEINNWNLRILCERV